ncbi:phage terminase small subunit P27 family [Streptomyces sp. NBC_00385]|uniref:phage terminase small subunit P27 family n=1 Tax=Streptomyces sp. NBC_00385 TaxID=2975733 RepID=UPI002DDA8BBE|nr:phage terminase small subunit P27 family [Streptomyces sp. NBC_00385]WRZ05075.1 phage terminase small subunit P27 family [Streptomyces sp. NBC_00385]
MGERGPIGQPDNVRALRGNPGGRPAPKRVTAAPGVPDAPEWLDAEALAEWDRIVPDLDRLGVLALVDRAALSTYCAAWSVWVRAERLLQEDDLVAERRAGNGPAKHPAWQVWREAATTVSALAKELFITPSSRLRSVKPEDNDDGEDDILD